MRFHSFTESVNDILPRMLKVIRTKNWQLYWGPYELPEDAEVLGLVTPDKRSTGALIRLSYGTYVQGNTGQIKTLPQKAVEKALAVAERASAQRRKPVKRKPSRQ